MLSNQNKYAIQGVLYLAMHASEKKKMGSAEVSRATHIPPSFLAKIFQKLSKQGLIRSAKGPSGGFYLTDSEKQMGLLDIIEAIDGLGYFEQCFMGLKACNNEQPCAIHDLLAPSRDLLLQDLQRKTIGEIAANTEKGQNLFY